MGWALFWFFLFCFMLFVWIARRLNKRIKELEDVLAPYVEEKAADGLPERRRG